MKLPTWMLFDGEMSRDNSRSKPLRLHWIFDPNVHPIFESFVHPHHQHLCFYRDRDPKIYSWVNRCSGQRRWQLSKLSGKLTHWKSTRSPFVNQTLAMKNCTSLGVFFPMATLISSGSCPFFFRQSWPSCQRWCLLEQHPKNDEVPSQSQSPKSMGKRLNFHHFHIEGDLLRTGRYRTIS